MPRTGKNGRRALVGLLHSDRIVVPGRGGAAPLEGRAYWQRPWPEVRSRACKLVAIIRKAEAVDKEVSRARSETE